MNEESEINLKLNQANRGGFYIIKNGFQVAEMEIAIQDQKLFVFHTEVSPELKGQNLGKKLLDEMVNYAHKNNLTVMPYALLCEPSLEGIRRNLQMFGRNNIASICKTILKFGM